MTDIPYNQRTKVSFKTRYARVQIEYGSSM